ncbi:MAG TPA: polysaccharide deacetylase family protein [Casimicrobiaceae bacterium]|nr:polysaccharide deacetylase family protein [Casimicrobiaceae bacterium]
MAGGPLTPRPPVPGRLDHDLYDARFAPRDPGVRWPGERDVAAFALVHVEAFEIDAPAGARRDPALRGDFGSFFPDYRAHSLVEYGTRIGIFRLLDVLQPLGWHVAAAVNGLVARQRPLLVRDLAARGVEVLASGWSASRMITSAMDADEERASLAQSIDAVAQATGASPRGYASQDYGWSARTAAALESLGIAHAVDWPNDERPYRFGPQRRIVMLPAAAELDDAQAMLARKLQPRAWEATVREALDAWRERALPGSVFALPLHAWVAGAAHRTPALRRALAAHDGARFWQASPAAIAAHWHAAAPLGDAQRPPVSARR